MDLELNTEFSLEHAYISTIGSSMRDWNGKTIQYPHNEDTKAISAVLVTDKKKENEKADPKNHIYGDAEVRKDPNGKKYAEGKVGYEREYEDGKGGNLKFGVEGNGQIDENGKKGGGVKGRVDYNF